MTCTFHPEADEELDEASAYYEARQHGLGAEFIEEAYATIARILQYPRASPKASAVARRYRMRRFPYGIVYRLKPDSIRIYAVAQLNRMPGYWKRRMSDEG